MAQKHHFIAKITKMQREKNQAEMKTLNDEIESLSSGSAQGLLDVDSVASDQALYHDGYQQRTVNLDDEPTTMDMEIVTTDGVIGIVITDENGQVLFDEDMITTSSFSIEVPGKVHVRINCDGHKGSYSIYW